VSDRGTSDPGCCTDKARLLAAGYPRTLRMSTQTRRRWLGLLVTAFTGMSTVAHSQVPSPAQAQQMLRDNPALIARLQQMLRTSGLTPEQIRQRLRAQGYSEAMLDAYLPGNPADSTALPTDDVFAAIRALGIADSTQLDSLGASTRRVRLTAKQRDSIFMVDTLQPALKNDTKKTAVRRLLTPATFARKRR